MVLSDRLIRSAVSVNRIRSIAKAGLHRGGGSPRGGEICGVSNFVRTTSRFPAVYASVCIERVRSQSASDLRHGAAAYVRGDPKEREPRHQLGAAHRRRRGSCHPAHCHSGTLPSLRTTTRSCADAGAGVNKLESLRFTVQCM